MNKFNYFASTFLMIFFFFSRSVLADDNNCKEILNKNGDVALFSSVICPMDFAANKLYQLIPADVVGANLIAPITYNSDISNNIKLNAERQTSPYASFSVFQNILSEFHQLLFYIALAISFFAIIIKVFKVVIKNGDVNELILKVISVTFCSALILSFSVTTATEEKSKTTPIQSLFARFHISAIAIANSFASAGTFGLTASNQEVSVVQDNSNLIINKNTELARLYIEEAMCLHSVSVGGVEYEARVNGKGSNESIKNGAQFSSISQSTDNSSSSFEVFRDEQELRSGWLLSDERNAQVCLTRKLTPPSVSELVSKYSDRINKTIENIDLNSATSNELFSIWERHFSEIDNESESIKQAFTHYFFSRINWRLGGGDVLDNKSTSKLLQKRFDLSRDFIHEMVTQKCLSNRSSHKNTEDTIHELKDGSVGTPSFDLNCAVMKDGKLSMSFDASSNIHVFAQQAAQLKESHALRAINIHKSLLQTFNVDSATQEAYKLATKEIAVRNAERETNTENSKNLVIDAREKGFISIARNYLNIVENNEKVRKELRKKDIAISALSGVVSDSNYSIESGYLPLNSDFEAEMITLPSFVFAKEIDITSIEALSKLSESSFEAQVTTDHGGNAGSSIKYTGAEYIEYGAEAATTHSELIEHSVSSIFDRLYLNSQELETTRQDLSQTQLKHEVKKLCLNTEAKKADVEILGISVSDYNSYCSQEFDNALIANKNMALSMVENMAGLAVVTVTANGGAMLGKSVANKYKQSTADKKVSPNEAESFIDGIALPSSGIKGFVAGKVKKLASETYNNTSLAGVSGLIVGAGIVTSLASLITTALPNLFFEVLLWGIYGNALMMSMLSPVLICLIMIFSRDAIRSKVMNDWLIRLFVAPIMAILGLLSAILLSSLASQLNSAVVATMLVDNNIDLTQPVTIIKALACVILITISYFFLLWQMLKNLMSFLPEVLKLFDIKGQNEDDAEHHSAIMPLSIALSSAYSVASSITTNAYYKLSENTDKFNNTSDEATKAYIANISQIDGSTSTNAESKPEIINSATTEVKNHINNDKQRTAEAITSKEQETVSVSKDAESDLEEDNLPPKIPDDDR